MTEDVKKQCACACGSSAMLKVVLGLILLGLGFALSIIWWPYMLKLIKGCVGPFLILVGVITLAIAKD